MSGFTGEFDQIVANFYGDGQVYVTISSSDIGFTSSRCGVWTRVA
jgi:hypothetical protein